MKSKLLLKKNLKDGAFLNNALILIIIFVIIVIIVIIYKKFSDDKNLKMIESFKNAEKMSLSINTLPITMNMQISLCQLFNVSNVSINTATTLIVIKTNKIYTIIIPTIPSRLSFPYNAKFGTIINSIDTTNKNNNNNIIWNKNSSVNLIDTIKFESGTTPNNTTIKVNKKKSISKDSKICIIKQGGTGCNMVYLAYIYSAIAADSTNNSNFDTITLNKAIKGGGNVLTILP